MIHIRTMRVLALGCGIFAAGLGAMHPAVAQPAPDLRGERGSRHDIRFEEARIGRAIRALQDDRHDYGGHRVRAVSLLVQADRELQAAIQFDNQHPH